MPGDSFSWIPSDSSGLTGFMLCNAFRETHSRYLRCSSKDTRAHSASSLALARIPTVLKMSCSAANRSKACCSSCKRRSSAVLLHGRIANAGSTRQPPKEAANGKQIDEAIRCASK